MILINHKITHVTSDVKSDIIKLINLDVLDEKNIPKRMK